MDILNLAQYFLYFMFYSILGWIVETIYIYICTGKWCNRGFFIGPYCPIYGFGCVFIVILLGRYSDSPLVLFFMSLIICSSLEYFTSYILEKIFNARWWDYSKRKYNINGRICLETLVPFGIGGVVVIYLVHPFISRIVNLLSPNVKYIIAGVLAVIFLTDLIVSSKIIFSFKNKLSKLVKDNTGEIKDKIKSIFKKPSINRLMNSFPNIKNKFSKFKDK